MSSELPLPKLLAGEKVVYVKDISETSVLKPPSSLKELERLSLARRVSEVGEFGPVLASEALGSHKDEPALRRYEALFGRDSLRVVLDLLSEYPKLARATIIRLAELQGVEFNTAREEEPGRIIHEYRDPQFDEIARELSLERGWDWPYYGSVDSTPEYIRALVAYTESSSSRVEFLKHKYTGKDYKQHSLADSLVAAVNWVTKRLDSNKEGLLEYQRSNPNGIENQVWKDSWDAYFHSDGTMANHELGIASVEVQRVAIDSLMDAARVYQEHLGKVSEAFELRERAANLSRQLINIFWTEEKGGYFVIGTDRDDKGTIRPLKIRASNMGHLLHSNLLIGEDRDRRRLRESLISQLFSENMLGYNGIMTLARDEIRFRDGAYHNGSVWGWDNYYIAQGLRFNGYPMLADFIEKRLLDGIKFSERYIEYMRGGYDPRHRINTRIVDVWDEKNQRVNRLEQPPQDMQAWTAAAVLAIKIRSKNVSTYKDTLDKKSRDFEEKILKKAKQI